MDELERYLSTHAAPFEDGSSPRLLREVAYERLKDAIRHADLEPGQPLPESRLSRILGISRTPVREALQQLSQEGLVEIIPGRVVTVASRTIRDVLNVVHIRLLLEPEMVRLTTEVISADQLETLRQTVNEMEEAVDKEDQEAWSIADTVFHETLSESCPNKLLGEIVVQMRNRVHHLANVDSQTNPRRLRECTAEHRQILEAMLVRDGQAAEKATRDHIIILRQSLFSRLGFG